MAFLSCGVINIKGGIAIMYMLYFHVPETHLDEAKNAVFAAGAGHVDNYTHCAWQTLGEGQFMPLTGSQAFIGEINQLEKVPEYKVETICAGERIKEVVAALKKAHPYESPSYQVVRIETEF
ncbi:TPA: NGG1p interacting factor NIF3 [Legionella pneumophila]|nr:NGG1p interacting factor NIF3 [Legionella pneumophila]